MRQFVASVLPDNKGRIALSEKEQKYLMSVLRMKEDDSVEVSFPNGKLATMKICFVNGDSKKNKKIELQLSELFEDFSSANSDEGECTEFWLFQFLPKGPKMDLIVRQAVECGANVIVPIIGEYSVVGKKQDSAKESINKVERWNRIIREARQQSGSKINTKIFSPCTIQEAIELWNENIGNKNKKGFVLRERDENQKSIFTVLNDIDGEKKIRIGFAIGCEGGISPSEIELLEKNGFEGIHFKTNILRAETAALYAFAVLQTAVMEWEEWKK